MPVIHTYASTPIPAPARESLKATYGQLIAQVPGKSEQWLMCLFDENVPGYLGGTDEPVAYITLDVFARQTIDPAVWAGLTPAICDALKDQLGIDPARVYVKYGESASFGWNGMNF